MRLNVIFSNKPSVLNKKLIKFFNINLLNLNKVSIVFDFEVAHPDNIDAYVKRGIKQYPILIDGNKNIIGVENIIEYLKSYIKKHNTKILNKTDTDRLDDFWKQTLGKIEVDESGNLKPDSDDDNCDDSAGNNLQHRIQEVFEQRNSETIKPSRPMSNNKINSIKTKSYDNSNDKPRKNNIKDDSPMKTLSKMKNSGNGNMDDVLMEKFFENLEES